MWALRVLKKVQSVTTKLNWAAKRAPKKQNFFSSKCIGPGRNGEMFGPRVQTFSYKFWGSKVQRDDYSWQHYTMYSVAKRENLQCSHPTRYIWADIGVN